MSKSLKKKLPKWLNSELAFYIAVAFLPFENFFFAPSSGWAAITPVILAFYIILNFKRVPKTLLTLRKIVGFFVVAIILGSITAFLNHVVMTDFIDAFIPLALGAILLFSFYIFYDKKKDLRTVVNIIVIAYAICAVIGLFEFLALQFGNHSFANWLAGLFKRNYLTSNGRVQFFFTEPSFIGMHLFGVLLPLYWLSRRKDLLFIIGLIAIEAILFGSGVRVALDIAVVAILYFGYLLFKHKKAKFIPLILLVLGLGFSYIYNHNVRVQKIVDSGVYADGSLASRYFRMQSSIIGYTKTPGQALVGYGLGNSLYPIHLGYDEAEEQYASTYRREVEDLNNQNLNYHDDSASYSLYTRMISEFGLILTAVALIYLVYLTKNSALPQRWLYLLVILYIYIQFESLGFYAIWIFIVTMLFTDRRILPKETLEARVSDNTLSGKPKKSPRKRGKNGKK